MIWSSSKILIECCFNLESLATVRCDSALPFSHDPNCPKASSIFPLLRRLPISSTLLLADDVTFSSSRPILKLEVSCCNRGSLSTCPSTRVRRSIPYDGSLSSSSFKSCVGLSTNIQARFFFLVSDHTVLRTRFIENQTAVLCFHFATLASFRRLAVVL